MKNKSTFIVLSLLILSQIEGMPTETPSLSPSSSGSLVDRTNKASPSSSGSVLSSPRNLNKEHIAALSSNTKPLRSSTHSLKSIGSSFSLKSESSEIKKQLLGSANVLQFYAWNRILKENGFESEILFAPEGYYSDLDEDKQPIVMHVIGDKYEFLLDPLNDIDGAFLSKIPSSDWLKFRHKITFDKGRHKESQDSEVTVSTKTSSRQEYLKISNIVGKMSKKEKSVRLSYEKTLAETYMKSQNQLVSKGLSSEQNENFNKSIPKDKKNNEKFILLLIEFYKKQITPLINKVGFLTSMEDLDPDKTSDILGSIITIESLKSSRQYLKVGTALDSAKDLDHARRKVQRKNSIVSRRSSMANSEVRSEIGTAFSANGDDSLLDGLMQDLDLHNSSPSVNGSPRSALLSPEGSVLGDDKSPKRSKTPVQFDLSNNSIHHIGNSGNNSDEDGSEKSLYSAGSNLSSKMLKIPRNEDDLDCFSDSSKKEEQFDESEVLFSQMESLKSSAVIALISGSAEGESEDHL